jgi:hypothetical protein
MYVYNDVAIVQTRQVQAWGEPGPSLAPTGHTAQHWPHVECCKEMIKKSYTVLLAVLTQCVSPFEWFSPVGVFEMRCLWCYGLSRTAEEEGDMKCHSMCFWDMIPCSLVGGYKCFRGTYCFSLQNKISSETLVPCLRLHGIITQNTTILWDQLSRVQRLYQTGFWIDDWIHWTQLNYTTVITPYSSL